MLTLRELISDLDVRSVSGGDELDAPVRWVHISELEDPTPFLSGGELLLTTGMPLTDEKTQREYVARLARHGLAGLGLGTGFAHETMPAALVEAAAEHGFAAVRGALRAAVHRAHREGLHAPGQRAVRGAAARARRARAARADRALRAGARRRRRRAVVADRRPGDDLRRARRGARLRRARTPRVAAELGAELRERMRAGARRGFAPGGELEGRALALPVARATGDERGARRRGWSPPSTSGR